MSHLRRVVLFLIITGCVAIVLDPMRYWWSTTFILDRTFQSAFVWFNYLTGLEWLFEFAWSLAAGFLVALVMRSNSPIWWAVALGGVYGMMHFLRVRVHFSPEARWIDFIWTYGTYLVPLLGTFVGAWVASHLFFRGSSNVYAGGIMETPARWVVIVFAGVGAAFVAVELTTVIRHPSRLWSSEVAAYSRVGDKNLAAEISEKDLVASPPWKTNEPLPLRAEDAILRAQEALPALGQPVEGWSFSELALRAESTHFFYTVTFRPPKDLSSEWVQLPVYFNGKVTVPAALK